MKFHNFSIILIIFLILISTTVVHSADNMDSQHPAITQNISPEHMPGSNMIGAGRGHRVQNWKASQAANPANHPHQQPVPQQPSTHQNGASPADRR